MSKIAQSIWWPSPINSIVFFYLSLCRKQLNVCIDMMSLLSTLVLWQPLSMDPRRLIQGQPLIATSRLQWNINSILNLKLLFLKLRLKKFIFRIFALAISIFVYKLCTNSKDDNTFSCCHWIASNLWLPPSVNTAIQYGNPPFPLS